MIFANPEDSQEDQVKAEAEAGMLTLLRIYDTLMAMYAESNLEAANRLYSLHQAGGLGSPMPNFDPANLLSE